MYPLRLVRLVLLIGVMVGPPSALAQPAAGSEPVLKVIGATGQSLMFTVADLAKLPRATESVVSEKGEKEVYEGVAMFEILRRVDASSGKDLRRSGMDLCLIVTASDGYRVLFALPELDPAFTEHATLLADHRDGKLLAPTEGPLRIVVPGEKLHARWIRNVTALTLRRVN